jgi:uncharacterized protein YceH (UPF0502 family)
MHPFETVQDVLERLQPLTKGDEPLVQLIPRARLGQKENRYAQLLSGTVSLDEPLPAAPAPARTAPRDELRAEIQRCEMNWRHCARSSRHSRSSSSSYRSPASN